MAPARHPASPGTANGAILRLSSPSSPAKCRKPGRTNCTSGVVLKSPARLMSALKSAARHGAYTRPSRVVLPNSWASTRHCLPQIQSRSVHHVSALPGRTCVAATRLFFGNASRRPTMAIIAITIGNAPMPGVLKVPPAYIVVPSGDNLALAMHCQLPLAGCANLPTGFPPCYVRGAQTPSRQMLPGQSLLVRQDLAGQPPPPRTQVTEL